MPEEKILPTVPLEEIFCPFCYVTPPKNTAIERILKDGEYWRVFHNPFPYLGLKYHIIIATKEHLTLIGEVLPEMEAELFEHIEWVNREFKIPGGGTISKFGDPKYHTGSQEHIHFHFLQPGGTVPLDEIFYHRRR